jgi:hypothetical protein
MLFKFAKLFGLDVPAQYGGAKASALVYAGLGPVGAGGRELEIAVAEVCIGVPRDPVIALEQSS